MVRIINGEIVSDDDPRVTGAQRRSGAGSGGSGGGGGQARAGYGRVASLLDPPATPSNDGRNTSRGHGGAPGAQAQEQPPGPLDKVAGLIGVHGRSVTIPGVLGMPEKQLPIIYLIVFAIAVLIGGWKVAGILVFMYVLVNQKGRAR